MKLLLLYLFWWICPLSVCFDESDPYPFFESAPYLFVLMNLPLIWLINLPLICLFWWICPFFFVLMNLPLLYLFSWICPFFICFHESAPSLIVLMTLPLLCSFFHFVGHLEWQALWFPCSSSVCWWHPGIRSIIHAKRCSCNPSVFRFQICSW